MWRRPRRTDEDFADEIRAHLAFEAERLVEQGMTPDEARAAAHRAFGSVTRSRERFHESRRIVWVEQFVQDLRYALRGLRQSRMFVASTVLTLAIGMGLVTVVFAVFNAYVLRPFAVFDPYRLYGIGWRAQEAAGSNFRWLDYEAFQARHDLFDGVVAAVKRPIASGDRQLSIGFVSGSYFDTLGARIALGRSLSSDDVSSPGASPVAVLTHQTWKRLFEADPAALGREIELRGTKFTVIGVMGPEFVGLDDVPLDLWVPVTMYGALAGEDLFGSTQPRVLLITARLRKDVTAAHAQGSLTIAPFETAVSGRVDNVRARLELQATPVRLTFSGFAVLSPVVAAFVLVLIAACANASNVMLARANARHREIGIRLSIGASRSRIVRQLLTEGLLIALLAGAAGVALAGVLLRLGVVLFVAMLPPAIALRVRFIPLEFDYRVFAFACLMAGAVTILFALLPALQATRLTLTDALRGHAANGLRSSTLRNLLVTGQVAVSLVLLIVASTIVRNGAAIRATHLGLETQDVISVRQHRGSRTLVQQGYETLGADPRVEQVVATSRNPLFGEPPSVILDVPAGVVRATYSFVSPGYHSLLGVPIVRGRLFSIEESRQEAPVVIVSVSAAERLWPGEDPIGKTLRLNIEPPGTRLAVGNMMHILQRRGEDVPGAFVGTVIGVAANALNGFVYEGAGLPHLYLPTSSTGARAEALMVRGRDAGLTAETVRSILQRAHPDPVAYDVLSLDDMHALQMFPLRAASGIGSLLSAVALLLSISGLYGVLTYTMGQRTQEIGIRMALGASASTIRRLVLLQSVRFAGIGMALGLLLGFSVMKLLSTVIHLENVSVMDPGAFTGSLALIAAAVVLSSFVPARRASQVDPSSMLRADA